jgi:type IV pilus assembly protein PilN
MMRISVNLASEPFRRDRPMLVASAAAGVALAALFVMLVVLAVSERGAAAQARQDMALLQQRLQRLSGEQARLEEVLRQPANAEVLDKAAFVNALLVRKGISWTRIFADLDAVMPYNVRLISIRPQVSGGSAVLLEMVVGAQSQPPVIEMLKRLESSPLFGATEVHNWQPPSQTEPLYRYRVTVSYGQKL